MPSSRAPSPASSSQTPVRAGPLRLVPDVPNADAFPWVAQGGIGRRPKHLAPQCPNTHPAILTPRSSAGLPTGGSDPSPAVKVLASALAGTSVCGWAPGPAAPRGQAQLGRWGVDLVLGKLSAPRDPAPLRALAHPTLPARMRFGGDPGAAPSKARGLLRDSGWNPESPVPAGCPGAPFSDARETSGCPDAALLCAVMVINYYYVEGDAPGASRPPAGRASSPHPAGVERGPERSGNCPRSHSGTPSWPAEPNLAPWLIQGLSQFTLDLSRDLGKHGQLL